MCIRDRPYRMFTSRAEHRLLLSQNNAEQRLIKKAFELGIVSNKRYKEFEEKEKKYKEFVSSVLEKTKIKTFKDKNNKAINLDEKKSIATILARPDVDEKKLLKLSGIEKELFNRASTEIKYKGYICLLYTSPSPRDLSTSRMPSSA